MQAKENLAPPGGPEPIAISGLGTITAAGAGAAALWDSLVSRRSHLGPLRQIPTAGLVMGHGGEVPDAALEAADLPPGSDRALAMACVAAGECLESAGLGSARPRGLRIGLGLGTALGSVQTLERLVAGEATTSHTTTVSAATKLTTPMTAAAWSAVPHGSLAGALAERFDLRGPSWCFSVTCASGLYALEQAIADLAFGRADVVLCGGLDTLSLFMQSGFCALRALSPSGRLRPFDRDHDGIVLGEGAAFITIERLDHARRRGARPRAIIAANELESDGAHLTSPDASGRGMARAIARALRNAGPRGERLGLITPTATGSPIYDRMQSRAILEALGERGAAVPVTTWEPAVGHALAATGILGIAHAALALEESRIAPVCGMETLDEECRLRYVLEDDARLEGDAVLLSTVGFGGQNGATIIARAAPSVGRGEDAA